MALVPVELSDDELAEVIEKLAIYAYSLVPKNSVMRGLGDGPDDLVDEVLRKWWDPSTTLKWNTERGEPNLGGLIALLKKALRNLFLDRMKTADYKRSTTSLDAEEPPSHLVAQPRAHDAEALVAKVYLGELTERVLASALAAEDIEVVCYVELQTTEGGPYKNQKAAERLSIAPKDVVNLRKRLDRYALKARDGMAPKARAVE